MAETGVLAAQPPPALQEPLLGRLPNAAPIPKKRFGELPVRLTLRMMPSHQGTTELQSDAEMLQPPIAPDLFRHYRNEVQHEMDLMLARLNALLTSQSFLIIAYATSMAVSNGQWRRPLPVLLPPFLAILGFILALEGRGGILAAQSALKRWQDRLDTLVAQHPGLKLLADTPGIPSAKTRRAGEIFAVRPPTVFIIGWTWLFCLPFILRFLDVPM